MHQDKLRVRPAEGHREWEFRCPRCSATGVYLFKRQAGWCDGCSTTFVQISKGEGLRLASEHDNDNPRWVRVQVQPAEIF